VLLLMSCAGVAVTPQQVLHVILAAPAVMAVEIQLWRCHPGLPAAAQSVSGLT
jgi:hypothetical protein